MDPSKLIPLALLSLNILTVLILGFSQYFASQTPSKPPSTILQEFAIQDNRYQFYEPEIALNILKQLDVFEAVGDKSVDGANYKRLAGGFIPNNNYCDEHRAYFVNHPELVFESKNIVTNYWKSHKLRTQVIPSINAVDMYPQVHPNVKVDKFLYELTPNANVFVMHNLFYYSRQVGKQFSCLSQASNHVPGHDKMYRKDRVGESLVEYTKKYQTRPHCFNYEKWFPKTWVLQKKEQCKEFFTEFLSPKYQQLKKERNVVYFRKIGADVHEGKGVFPVATEEEQYIQTLYKNGTLCGKIKDNNLIQYNVHNLLLVENRKFGFRSFLLIASANPLIAYYHDGYARLSMNEYDTNSKEIKTFVTNIGVNIKEASQGTIYQNMTPAEINEHTYWSLEDFQDYLLEKQIVSDPNYLDNTLRPEFKKVMIHLLRMAQSGFFQKSSVYEVFGLDFVMDENMNLWFIEANSMPLVNGFSKGSTVLLNKMLVDTFDIVMGLAKSRMKRVIDYVNNLTYQVDVDFQGELPDLAKRRKEFKEITKNYFEPEFEPATDNSYHRIIYEKDVGVKRYSGLLTKECL